MKYMMFIKHPETVRVEEIPPGLMEAMGEFVTEGLKSGALVETAGLKPTKDGKRVTLQKGKIQVIDGPFAESKEIVGGFAIVEAKSDADALAYARKFMELHQTHWPAFEGECELRPYEAM